jgi:DNA-binding transcriptional ArsR family regulator
MSDERRTTPSSAIRRDYDLADELDVSEPQRLKALGDPLRLQICDLVLERAMSVTELAAVVDRPKGTVAYHVDVLLAAGLLQVVHTRQVRAIEERFYGRVARTFNFPGTSGELAFLDTVVAEVDHRRLDDAADRREGKDGSLGTVTYRHARLPPDRVAEYSRRLHALALEFVDEPRSGDIEFGLYVALFPTNRLKDRST